ncbi:hypothetical protein [Ignatzschineria cameli]|uniref:Uncharacterized protein n=1 Tax=Ignatzschineria cameli TaxID=2182793 RepID=A0A2U2ARR7_9GAMM|nr:hypothetical protein [Ignatzschineria cameli]PWD86697.1 hypothetical protein DC080_03450 [Ignatzschineria cameli]PWD86950.1 hypothetical protein DC077_03810 [Ignatzschineria cameli]PWD91922.1 hypothetical protein DC079_00745 [Ignatzschineria cameli]PWD93491.1 hypothetical protein DC081_01440 [Ignatzschineria cameli]PWD94233.1 hypothetical protein DC078_01440 [Ignatzschineria cameli]
MRREQGSILLAMLILFALCGLYLSSSIIALQLKNFQIQRWRVSLEEREAQTQLFLQNREDVEWRSALRSVSRDDCRLFDRRDLQDKSGFQIQKFKTGCGFGMDRMIYRLSLRNEGEKSQYRSVLYQYHFLSQAPTLLLKPRLKVERQKGYWELQVESGEVQFITRLEDRLLIEKGIDLTHENLQNFTVIPLEGAAGEDDMFFILQGGRYLWSLSKGREPSLIFQLFPKELFLAAIFDIKRQHLSLLVAENSSFKSESLGIYSFVIEGERYQRDYRRLVDDHLLTYQGISNRDNFFVEKINRHYLILRGKLRRNLGGEVREMLMGVRWNGEPLWGDHLFWERSAAECGFQQMDYEPIPGWKIGCQRKTPTKPLYLY